MISSVHPSINDVQVKGSCNSFPRQAISQEWFTAEGPWLADMLTIDIPVIEISVAVRSIVPNITITR